MKAVLIFMYFAMPSGVAADPSPEPGTAAYVYAETVGANDIKVPVYFHPRIMAGRGRSYLTRYARCWAQRAVIPKGMDRRGR